MTRPFLSSAAALVGDPLTEILAAADRQDRTDTSAMAPGPLAPGRELGGEMPLEMKRPAHALQAFEATMQKKPNRFRTLYRAANAASLPSDREKARRYDRQLIDICARAHAPRRAEIRDVRKAVKS